MNDTSRFRRGLKTLWSGTPKTRVRISTVSRNLKALALMTRCGTLRRLVREGHIHNYLRMLWGKKIIEWSASPRAALSILIELNNKYGLDGRNPNSYSGIFWCLGRYDRPWGPERPIFGMVRYMSSENTARKFSVRNYIQKFTVAKRTTLTF
jgi:deoxyribodipyrimidine photolyase